MEKLVKEVLNLTGIKVLYFNKQIDFNLNGKKFLINGIDDKYVYTLNVNDENEEDFMNEYKFNHEILTTEQKLEIQQRLEFFTRLKVGDEFSVLYDSTSYPNCVVKHDKKHKLILKYFGISCSKTFYVTDPNIKFYQ